MKRFADEQEPVVGVPLVVEPVVVEDAPAGTAVQHRDVTVVTVHRGRARPVRVEGHPDHLPPFAKGGMNFIRDH